MDMTTSQTAGWRAARGQCHGNHGDTQSARAGTGRTIRPDPNGRAVQVCLDDENGKSKCTMMSDAQYGKAYQNNPGVDAPAAGATAGQGGGLPMGGTITWWGIRVRVCDVSRGIDAGG